ncbi:hypothetical protein FOL47_006579 [Perkinsus chesapeaki]|uniref:Flavoprotein pyridine nucleotide cytochrome reductase-like FAD-binding domain-containing protein n=1 Tax=Perkinsus chesapeaki TaxID=330153 RepID=A0A7J6MX45_PERCH|nr:hypothetical protein FOL47_006579 [Perkinsus chesapeaki]
MAAPSQSSFRVAPADQPIPVGGSIEVSILCEPFVIFHVSEGKYYAIQNPCVACFSPSTFLNQPVDADSLTVQCAHGGHKISLVDGTAVDGGMGQISAKVSFVEGDGLYLELPEALADWSVWTLVERRNVAKNVDAFVFSFPEGIRNEDILFGDGIMHISSKIMVDGASCARDYTPTRKLPNRRIELIVKRYDDFGIMSRHYHNMVVGDTLVQRVNTRIRFNLSKLIKEKGMKKIVMVGAGTGVTPLYQVMFSEANKMLDEVQILGFFRETKEMILYPDEDMPKNVTMRRFLTRRQGCADALQEMFDREYFPRGDGTKSMYIIWCGPPGFNAILDSQLEKRDFYGFDEDCVYELPN